MRADFVSTLFLWFLVDACFLYEFCGNEISEFIPPYLRGRRSISTQFCPSIIVQIARSKNFARGRNVQRGSHAQEIK